MVSISAFNSSSISLLSRVLVAFYNAAKRFEVQWNSGSANRATQDKIQVFLRTASAFFLNCRGMRLILQFLIVDKRAFKL